MHWIQPLRDSRKQAEQQRTAQPCPMLCAGPSPALRAALGFTLTLGSLQDEGQALKRPHSPSFLLSSTTEPPDSQQRPCQLLSWSKLPTQPGWAGCRTPSEETLSHQPPPPALALESCHSRLRSSSAHGERQSEEREPGRGEGARQGYEGSGDSRKENRGKTRTVLGGGRCITGFSRELLQHVLRQG